jgi:hypothetical protein
MLVRGALPVFETYGNYSSSNYGAHALRFQVGTLSIWFSYKTPVAFYTPKTGRVVRQNSWGPTTGKHLNAIDGGDKGGRVDSGIFERMLAEVTAECER